MELRPYKTFLSPGEGEFVINKSRFIGAGAPVSTEEEALDFLARRRKLHPGANHACYAYIVGANAGIMRYSDDGEPGGTAGLPMMEVLKARGVTNCCCVATRYFGGVLLGAGGLTRAYSKSVATAVSACGVGVMWPTERFLMEVPYPMLGRFEYFLADQPVRVEDKSFTDAVTITAVVRTRDAEGFFRQAADATNGEVEPVPVEECYLPWPEAE